MVDMTDNDEKMKIDHRIQYVQTQKITETITSNGFEQLESHETTNNNENSQITHKPPLIIITE